MDTYFTQNNVGDVPIRTQTWPGDIQHSSVLTFGLVGADPQAVLVKYSVVVIAGVKTLAPCSLQP